MQFEHANYLWLVPPAMAVLVAFFWWALRVRRSLAKQFVAARLMDVLTVGVSTTRLKVRLGLLAATNCFASERLTRNAHQKNATSTAIAGGTSQR